MSNNLINPKLTAAKMMLMLINQQIKKLEFNKKRLEAYING